MENCAAVAGMSVGEFTALIFTGAMSLNAGVCSCYRGGSVFDMKRFMV